MPMPVPGTVWANKVKVLISDFEYDFIEEYTMGSLIVSNNV